jgi:hypothetical protein
VYHCIATWRIHNPDWEIFLLNSENWGLHISAEEMGFLKFNESPNRFSDYLRLSLLVKYGGVWMDSTIIAFGSLDSLYAYKPPYAAWSAPNPAQFIAFARQSISASLDFPICDSWFLASEMGGEIVTLAKAEMMRMQTFDTILDYIDDLESQGTQIRQLSTVEYAIVYGWINHALRQSRDNDFRARLYEGVSPVVGPYWYMHDQWDAKIPMERICTDASYRTILLKLGGPQRRHLDEHPELSCILRMQHGVADMDVMERNLEFSPMGLLK